MEAFRKKLLASGILALLFTVCGVILMFTFSVLYNSRQSLDGMIKQEAIKQSLQEQNEEYYNKIYDRYDMVISDLTDYQQQSNARLKALEEDIDELKSTLEAQEQE